MKKIGIFLLVSVAAIAVAQTLELNKVIRKQLTRTFNVSGQAQKNKLEDLWSLVDRPAKTNATMIRVEVYRTVVAGVSTNYVVKAVDNIWVKLVEN